MTDVKEISSRLQEPFHSDDLEWRIQNSGFQKDGTPWAMVFTYVTARAIQDRLDDVVGIDGWYVNYSFVGKEESVICNLSLKFGNDWITKSDGSEQTDFESFRAVFRVHLSVLQQFLVS